MKVLLDTDCDLGDVDDALCLDYLLRQPACELVGITTVAGDTLHQARVASMLCRAAGRDVPIAAGAPRPLLAPALPASLEPQLASLARLRAAEETVLARWPHEADPEPGGALELQRRLIRTHPGEVVLLGIGPLTNVALLLTADPSLADLLRGLVLMAGDFGGQGGPEWNAGYDPHASAVAYRAGVRWHRSVGFDVTARTGLDEAAYRARLGDRPRRPLDDLVDAWFAERDGIWFHDPLTAATLFEDGLCGFARGTVEPAGDGSTSFRPDEGGPHEVARRVDVPALHRHRFAVSG